MSANQNAVTVTATMSSLHDRGGHRWEIKCHDAGQVWWEELPVARDWQLISKDTIEKGYPRCMGTYRLTFVSPDAVTKTRRRVEDVLRKGNAATIFMVAAELGLRPSLEFGLTDEELY